MKMNKSGKLLSIVLMLMLMVSLIVAITITASANETEVQNPVTEDSSFFDLTKTSTHYEVCGKVRVVWNDVPDADMFIVYVDGIHKAYTVKTYYNFLFDTVDHGVDLDYHTVTIDAIKDEVIIASGTIEIAAEHKYTPRVTPSKCEEYGYTENICTCGYSYIIEDSYTDPLGHDMLVANCTQPDRCKRDGCDYTIGEALGHIWSDWESNGDDTHTRLCHRYEELPIEEWHSETESCAGGLATCLAKAVCGTCNTEYGSIAPDTHTGVRIWADIAEAKDMHKSVYTCCGVIAIPQENHEWDNGVCTECGYVCVHEGGVATCVDLKVCDHCSMSYGELDPENHTKDWTWTDRGDVHTAMYMCGCETIFISGEHQWQVDDNENVFCTVCGVYQHVHVGGEATCNGRAVCELCGLNYGYVDPNNHSGNANWTKTDLYHESRWSCCGVVNVITEFHNWNNGECTECGYKCAHVADIDDGNCTTAIHCIKCNAVVTPGTAGHTPEEDDGDCTTALHCTQCSVVLTPARETHTGGKATCTEFKKCEVCGSDYDLPLGHNMNAPTKVNPTCDNNGYDLYTCTVCGYQLTDNIVPALGHDMSVFVPGVTPTCTSAGYQEYYKCKTCGYHTNIVTLDKLHHNLVNVEAEYDDSTFFINRYDLCQDCGYADNHQFSRINFKCKTITTVLIIIIVTVVVLVVAMIGIYAAAPTTTPGRVVFRVILTLAIGAGLIVLAYLILGAFGQTIYDMFGPNVG